MQLNEEENATRSIGFIETDDATRFDVWDLLQQRRSVSPKHLASPGLSRFELDQIFACAATAPDHGRYTPWRFVVISDQNRTLLADAFEAALIDRDGDASQEQRIQAREKAFRSPTLVLIVAKVAPNAHAHVAVEGLVSLGAAVQSMLLIATQMGYGSCLTSGQAMQSTHIRRLFLLHDDEMAVCFLNMGTTIKHRSPRSYPSADRFVSYL